MTWRSKRRAAALAQAVAIAGLPFLRVGGDSALRFDIPTASLRFFGRIVRLDEFHLVLLGLLFVLAVLVGLTAILGRVWCGWLCGQTVLPELASWAAAPLPPRRRRAAAEWLLLPLSALVSFSILCYVLPPADAARALVRSPFAAGAFFVMWAAVYGMAGLLGPRFCRSICPYAMLQNVLFDDDTLRVGFDRRRADECLDCSACVGACPMGIDIRDGLSRECVACAACIDACATATRARRVAPFVGYRGRVLRGRAALFAALAAAAAGALALAVELRPPADAWVHWEGSVAGAPVERYAWRVTNNRGRPLPVGLRAEGGGTLIGDREVVVAAWSRREGRVMIRRGEGAATLVLSAPGLEVRGGAAAPGGPAAPPPSADIHSGPVSATAGAVRVTLDVSPRPVRAMRTLTFTVTASPPARDGEARIDLAMPGMRMPQNRVRLTKGSDGAFRGTGTIVRCMSGRRAWTAEVALPGTAPVTFAFDVAD